MWKICDYRGTEKAVVHEVEYEGNHGGARTLTCSISSPMPIAWEVTDNIYYRGEIFYLRHIPQAKKQARVLTHKEAFIYDNVVFYSAIDELASCDFLDVVKEDNNLHYTSLPNFSFYCETIYDIADRLQANLDRLYTGSKKWTIQVSTDITAKVDIKPQALSFSSEKCSQVLERIYNDLGVTYEHTNRTIVFGAKPIIMPYEFQYGKGKGLKSIEQSGADGNALVTRVRVYGSTRNLPNRYYNKLYKNSKTGAVMYFKTDEDKPKDFETYWKPLISETMYVPNLMLPMFRENGKDAYIDAPGAIAKYGLREGTKFFDSNNGEDEEIYPTIENMTADRLEELGYTPELHDGDNGKLDELLYVDDVPFSGVMPEGGNLPASEAHFVVYLKDIGFDINDYWVGTPKISFRSGALAGREFDIVKCEQTALINKTYKLTCKRVEDTSIQLIFPYKDYKPSAGDKFVLLEIDMPEIYIKVAEVRLKEEGDKWLGLNSNPIFTYNPEIDAVNVLRNPQIAENLKEGRTFVFSDEDLGISKAIRISNLKIKDNGFAPEYEITLSDKHTVSLAEKVTQSVVNMIGSNNASTENIKALIEAYGNNLFLSKKKRDTADQVIRFSLGLEVGENKANINANGDAEVESLTSRSRVKASEVVADSIHTTDYAQGALMGTGGAIYQLEGATYAEIDYLTARKGATFAELIIQKYRSIGGALVISQANGEIESVYDYGNGYNIWIKDDDRSDSLFVNHDLVRCQYWDRGKNKLVYYWTSVSVSEDSQGRYMLTIYKKGMNGVVPQGGDKLVQMGNTTDKSRQGCILLTTEASMPRMAILDGIDEPKIYNTPEKTNYKGIYGSLENFVDPYTGKKLSGYGMWGENVHLHGDLILSSTNKSVADSLKDVGNGRNLLLGTNRGVENWLLSTSLDKGKYSMLGIDKNGAKGIQVVKRTTEESSWGEVLMFPLRPQFITKDKTYHISFDLMQSVNQEVGMTINLFLTTQNGSINNALNNIIKVKSINVNGVWQHHDYEFTAIRSGSETSGQLIYFGITKQNNPDGWVDFAIANLKLEEGVKATEWTSAPEDAQDEYDRLADAIAQTTATLTQDIININNRLDGVVENWFYKGYPNPQNAPAIEWTNAQEKYNHIGDTFTSIDENGDYAGKSWRWIGVTAEPSFEIDFTTGSINGVTYYFYWQTIADSDAIKALQQAKNAQDTADSKRRVFVAQPTTPYDEGDLWVNTTENGVTTIYCCVTSKADGNVFSNNDWQLAATDNTELNDYKEVVSGEFAVTNGRFDSIQNTITEQGNKIEANTSKIQQTADNISLTIKSLTWDNQNLLLNSAKVINDRNYLLGFYDLGDFKPINNSKVTLSFSGYLGNGHGMFKIYNSGWQTQITTLNVSDYNPTTQRYEKTFDWVIGNTENTYINIFQADINGNAITDYGDASIVASKIYNIKLEFSSKATSWTPAPEDTNQALKDTGIDIKSKKITVTADQFTIKNNNGNITASADESGNWSTNALKTLQEDNATPAITANYLGDKALKFYHSNGFVQMEIGWDANSNSLMRYYNDRGEMLWKIGSEQGFLSPSDTDNKPTEIFLWYIANNTHNFDTVYNRASNYVTAPSEEISKFYQGKSSGLFSRNEAMTEYLSGWFSPTLTATGGGEADGYAYYRFVWRLDQGKIIDSQTISWVYPNSNN